MTIYFWLQDYLNMFFKDIYKPIPNVYNLVLALLWRHPENVDLEKVKVVHYCAAGSKPWRYTGEEVNMDREDIKMLVEKWREIYDDETLDYIKRPAVISGAAATAGEAENAGGLKTVLSGTTGMVKCITAPSAA